MAKPWEDAPELWKDEAAYCQWLRSQARRIWARHPIKNKYKAARTQPAEGMLGFKEQYPRAKKACQCEMCGNWFPASKIEVDHIQQAGSFKSVQEWYFWLDRLLNIGFEDIRLLCKVTCHPLVTLSQRFGCSIEEAMKRQQLADFRKLKAASQRTVLLNLGLDNSGNKDSREKLFWVHINSIKE